MYLLAMLNNTELVFAAWKPEVGIYSPAPEQGAGLTAPGFQPNAQPSSFCF